MSKTPEGTLKLIREGYYDTDRPSYYIIEDLLNLIVHLDDKIRDLQHPLQRNKWNTD